MKKNTDLIVHHLFWRVLYFFSILLINIAIARFFAAEQSGHIFFIVSNLSLILLVVSLSLESGAAYYIASGKLESLAMARFCLLWALIASAIALGAWWILLQIVHGRNISHPDWLFPAFLFIAGVLMTTYFTGLFYARKEFGVPNKILFTVNLLLIFLMIMEKNQPRLKNDFVLIYFSSFFLQGLLVCLFFFAKHRGTYKPFFPGRSLLKKVLRYSLIALLANGLYFLVNRIDYWFVQHFCSPKDLGNYIQASKLGQMLLILPSILGSTLFPIFSSGEKTENTQDLTSVMRILLWFNLIICILIICIGRTVFPWIFGPSFDQMYLLFILLIPGILAFTMNYPLAAWFSGRNRMGINIRGTLIALVVICVGDLLTIPTMGVRFASIFSSAGYFCYYCYTVYKYRELYPLPWNEFFLIRKSDLGRIYRLTGKKMLDSSAIHPAVSNKNT